MFCPTANSWWETRTGRVAGRWWYTSCTIESDFFENFSKLETLRYIQLLKWCCLICLLTCLWDIFPKSNEIQDFSHKIMHCWSSIQKWSKNDRHWNQNTSTSSDRFSTADTNEMSIYSKFQLLRIYYNIHCEKKYKASAVLHTKYWIMFRDENLFFQLW